MNLSMLHMLFDLASFLRSLSFVPLLAVSDIPFLVRVNILSLFITSTTNKPATESNATNVLYFDYAIDQASFPLHHKHLMRIEG